MSFAHLLLVLLVVIVWGFNFLFVKLGLNEIPPLQLCAIRFLLASVPAIFFIKPPNAAFSKVAAYGLVMFAMQFSLLFMGMYVGMTPGLASLIMQVQVFFSMFFAALVINEIPNKRQIVGAVISFLGIGLVAMHTDATVSFVGFALILAAAAAWGFGNLITKQFVDINIIALIVWGSFVACFPMFILSLLLEGPMSFAQSYQDLTWVGVASVLYITFGSTWLGYGLWNWLLSRHPVSTIVPFTLLVPVVGMLASIIFLEEPFFLWKLNAGLLVIAGLCINFKIFQFKKDKATRNVIETNT